MTFFGTHFHIVKPVFPPLWMYSSESSLSSCSHLSQLAGPSSRGSLYFLPVLEILFPQPHSSVFHDLVLHVGWVQLLAVS